MPKKIPNSFCHHCLPPFQFFPIFGFRQLDEMLKEVDSDRSGTIDYQEFLTSRLGVQLG